MQRIACDTCGVRILAEKYSARHTSVQWLDETPACSGKCGSSSLCTELYDSIDRAALEGILPYSLRTEPTLGKLE